MTFPRIGERGQQPPQKRGDATFSIHREEIEGEEQLVIRVWTADKHMLLGQIALSEYNAWALFGGLSMFLGIQLPKNLANKIKLF